MIHSLILSDRRNNQYKTLGILIFIIYPVLSFPFILKGILKRERWAYLLGAIFMGYMGMLYPPAGDMYRYAEDFNLYKFHRLKQFGQNPFERDKLKRLKGQVI